MARSDEYGSTKAAPESAAEAQPKRDLGWPLPYALQPPKPPSTLHAPGLVTNQTVAAQKPWWSHTMYRGPDGESPKVLYSKTKEQSEELARLFAKEKFIGFDMEWPIFGNEQLQQKIGLIQIATQDKIALFHIGLHRGKTTDEIIAPTLRQIIESAAIGKIGVAVLNADFSRLSKFFRLKPKGAVELSHLYRLVTFGHRKPQEVSTKMVSLAHLVESQFGYPLYKGDVRTSNWSRPLSRSQISYAAGDAYAGFMLYHCMNAKRLKMEPVPPLPIHADRYQGIQHSLPRIGRLLLEPSEEGGGVVSSDVFFGVPVQKHRSKDSSKSITAIQEAIPQGTTAPSPTQPPSLLDETTRRLYQELVDRRKSLANTAGLKTYMIVHNAVLERIAVERPLDTDALLKIKGVGTHQKDKYGSIWIDVVKKFLATEQDTKTRPSTPDGNERRSESTGGSPDSSPAFESPSPPRKAQLPTGISFTFADTSLSNPVAYFEDSDSSLPDLDLSDFPPMESFGQKRKRAASPLKATRTSRQPVQEPQKEDKDPYLETGEAKIFRSKLLALSKLVARKLSMPADSGPIVSDETLDLIVCKQPKTLGELRKITGIEGLLQACFKADTDLLKNIVKFTPASK